ncbi:MULTISPECIES: TonB-dependent receptor [unclassified Arcicella]|uniref:SusC/RagA family TonB-linked outer membrane protein n=1 Tax=unclassified Arcicella TaxID=2644986 RepID=UPI00286062E2|nr:MULTISPECIES: TonB-dependent receptor [unclassified Arcicella]MDR6562045.1 TonB-linked SusC/RagA family outer membrane protein [Arcicella sp. BE51]MDR6811917.1 TonB-linked SusC/RagA family outer membrane protein [Arcicella sp. BE140]MDR6822947.1 TonB-linked SusC/RagA family outer membrane protein [Arcicella sp. BE139]
MDKHNQWKQHLRKLQSLFSIIIVLGITSFQSIANKSIKSSEQIINGIIKDEKGEALPGVNVIIKGTQKGVSSNQDGKYSITVNQKDATLIYSFVGYISQEVKISNQTIINITLQPAAKSLDEVVVIGYGTQKASDITGSVASFDAKHLEEKPISRIEQALVGQMAGVQVKQQSGLPGAGLSIVVRGTGSINAGSEPLYVIDGFPLDVAGQSSDGSIGTSPLANLSANDIESIQVLKDAAAGAIYGSRAANGVVLITTKKGKSGKLKINLNANSGISSIAKKLDILSADEWVNVATEVANINWVRSGTGRTADQTNDQRRAILGLKAGEYNTSYMPDERWSIAGHPGLQYVDWQDAIYRKASFQNYQLSATGGTENVSYFFSGNYLNQQSTLIGTDYKSYGVRANIEAKANKKLKFGINLAPTYSENNTPQGDGKDSPIMNIATISPVVEANAGLNSGAGEFATYTWSSPRLVSPYAILNNSIGLTKNTRLLTSIYAEYYILPSLFAKTTINYDDVNQQTKKYVSDYVAVGGAAERITNPGKNASGSYGGYRKQNFVNENTLNFIKTFDKVHNVAAVAGVSFNSVHSEAFNISTAGGFANNIVNTISNAIPNSAGVTVTGTTNENNNTLFSYYGRIQYDYQGRYLITGSIRRDASSKFGANNQWGTFPSASIGWRISQESFLKDSKVISDLKLRFSWGKSGNNNIGNYNAIPTLAGTSYNFGGNTPVVASGQVAAGLANPNLKWETSNTYDIGFDAALWNNRINVSFDAYTKKSTDLLLNLPVLGASGFSTSLQNIGSVKNQGLELGITTRNIVTPDFQWTTNANISFNRNEVISLNADGSPIYIPSAYSGSNAPYILQPGLPMFTYYVTKAVGILTQADIDDPKVAKIKNQTVGDTKYFDANNDGVINANDRVVYGQPNPKYTWGITNNFKYKNFDLSIQAYGQVGGSILSYFGRAIDFSGSTTANISGIWRERWTPENQNYDAPRGKLASTYTVPQVTSDWVYSTDFIRIQNVTLGYNLRDLAKTGVFSSARVYVSLQNWFNHDNYRGGVNPEAQNTNVSGNGSYPIPGDYGAMPLSKTASVGINLTF